MNIESFKPITKQGAAEILEISVRTVDYWRECELMPAPILIGQRCFWHPDIFYGWLNRALNSGVMNGRETADVLPAGSVKNHASTAAAEPTHPYWTRCTGKTARPSATAKTALSRQKTRIGKLNG